MQIRVVEGGAGGAVVHSLAVTMRTPGADEELAAGFLVSEGLLGERSDVWRIAHCEVDPENERNVVDVFLVPGATVDVEALRRNVYVSSSCGICGRTSLERVRVAAGSAPQGSFAIDAALLGTLPSRLEGEQELFARTGGLHAAALFDAHGELYGVREDVGRHNAVDKLVGWLWLTERLPASERILLVSGRASFELVQKAALAGMPMLAAVGAPSSLAVDLAREVGMTLVGFLRPDRCNVYCGEERVVG